MQPPFHQFSQDGDYSISHMHEDAFLSWPGGSLDIGDHYGDPKCGVINTAQGWCLAGGEGLTICLFPQPLTAECRPTNFSRLNLWRRGNRPLDGELCWFVEGAWLKEGDVARVLVDPLSRQAGLYDVNVRTLEWQKI